MRELKISAMLSYFVTFALFVLTASNFRGLWLVWMPLFVASIGTLITHIMGIIEIQAKGESRAGR